MSEDSAGSTGLHPYGPGSHDVLENDREMPGCYPIKGNIRNDGRRFYHRPDSRNYGATRAEVWFDSPWAAEAAGFALAPTHPSDVDPSVFEPGGSEHPCSVEQVEANRMEAAGGTGLHPYGPGSHDVLENDREMPGCYPIKGNIRNDGRRFYHRSDSRNYGATRAEVWFDSPSAAEAAGFALAPTHPSDVDPSVFEPGGSEHPCSVDQIEANRAAVVALIATAFTSDGDAAADADSDGGSSGGVTVAAVAAGAAALGFAHLGKSAADTDAHPNGVGSHAVLPNAMDMPRFYPIKGNVGGDGSRRYYRPDSTLYRSTKPQVWFDSSSSAEACGFTLSATHPTDGVAADYEPGGQRHPWSEADVESARLSAFYGPDGAPDGDGDGDGEGTVGAVAAGAAAIGGAAALANRLGGDDSDAVDEAVDTVDEAAGSPAARAAATVEAPRPAGPRGKGGADGDESDHDGSGKGKTAAAAGAAVAGGAALAGADALSGGAKDAITDAADKGKDAVADAATDTDKDRGEGKGAGSGAEGKTAAAAAGVAAVAGAKAASDAGDKAAELADSAAGKGKAAAGSAAGKGKAAAGSAAGSKGKAAAGSAAGKGKAAAGSAAGSKAKATASAAAAAGTGKGAGGKAAALAGGVAGAGESRFGGMFGPREGTDRRGCMHPIWLLLALVAGLLLIALLLSQCGGDDTATTDGATDSTEGGDTSGAPDDEPASPTTVAGGDEEEGSATSATDGDSELRIQALAALASAGLGDVDVEVNSGEIKLLGVVGNDDEMKAAEDAVTAVNGVTGVDNSLEMAEPSRSDDDIAAAALAALVAAGYDDVEVSVDGGVLTMTGEMADAAAVTGAAAALDGLDGADSVTNNLSVAETDDSPAATPVDEDPPFTG